MRRLAPIIIAAGIATGIIVSLVAVRTGLRLYALNKVLKLPGARQRANLIPKTKILAGSKLTNEVNIGYASFATGSTGKTLVLSTGSSGAFLLVSNWQFHLAILPPFASNPAANLSVAPDSHPKTARFTQKLQVDPVTAEVEMEEARELPLLKVAVMNQDEFLLYALTLGKKACFRRGGNEVYSFTTPRIKGIVRVGDSPEDRRVASAFIASLDGSENVGCHLSLRDSVSADVGQVLDEILRSFQFTTTNVSNRNEITNLIFSAGIRRRDESKPDSPADGSQPFR